MATLTRKTTYKTGGASYQQVGVRASVYVSPKMFVGPAPDTIEFNASNLAQPQDLEGQKAEKKAKVEAAKAERKAIAEQKKADKRAAIEQKKAEAKAAADAAKVRAQEEAAARKAAEPVHA